VSDGLRTVLGLVPARGGSKSILNKNIALVAGKPLIAYTIEAARAAPSVSRLVVSTDSPEIAAVARTHGAEVPFLRPSELAQDDTPGIAPVLHAVRWLEEEQSYRPDYVVLLQPTSPLRAPGDIEAAMELAREREADAVVSVCPARDHPSWMKRIDACGRLADFGASGEAYTRRQDLPPAYALNGAVYVARRGVLLELQTFYTARTHAYIMPLERSLDIDTPWDMYLAELILKDRCRHAIG
jgi:CMP-N,N'-diacetyllegionaminic acid synthase